MPHVVRFAAEGRRQPRGTTKERHRYDSSDDIARYRLLWRAKPPHRATKGDDKRSRRDCPAVRRPFHVEQTRRSIVTRRRRETEPKATKIADLNKRSAGVQTTSASSGWGQMGRHTVRLRWIRRVPDRRFVVGEDRRETRPCALSTNRRAVHRPHGRCRATRPNRGHGTKRRASATIREVLHELETRSGATEPLT